MRCFPKVAAWAELPLAQVTTTLGSRRWRRERSWPRGWANSIACRARMVGASSISSAMEERRLAMRWLRLRRETHGFRACQLQRAVERVTDGGMKELSRAVGKIGLHAYC